MYADVESKAAHIPIPTTAVVQQVGNRSLAQSARDMARARVSHTHDAYSTTPQHMKEIQLSLRIIALLQKEGRLRDAVKYALLQLCSS